MNKASTTIPSKSLKDIYAALKRSRDTNAKTVLAVVQARAAASQGRSAEEEAKNGSHLTSPDGGGKNRSTSANKPIRDSAANILTKLFFAKW